MILFTAELWLCGEQNCNMYSILKAGVQICANILKPFNERYEYHCLTATRFDQVLFRELILQYLAKVMA